MPIDVSEGLALNALRAFSHLDPGILIVHRKDEVRRVRRLALLERVQLQLEALRACEDRLQFKYAVERRIGDRFRREFGSGSKSCDFEGQRASLETGPGYCRIVVSRAERPNADEQRCIAEELGLPIDERWVGQGTVMIERELHDLRDARPVTVDGRSSVRATRRRWDTTILEKIATLESFLERSMDDWISVSVQ
jgi:hypothetical protein